MNSKKETLSRLGIASKGIVYILIGVLTALGAFGLKGENTSSEGALKFISEQSYGKILLIIIGLGLLSYVFYRFYQAISNVKDHENSPKGYVMRASYFVSGIVYGLLAFTAFKMTTGNNDSSSFVSDILNSEYGKIIAVIVAVCLAGKSIYEFYTAYSGKYKYQIEHTDIDTSSKSLLLKSGQIGFTCRGIVVGIMSFLFFKTAFIDTGKNIDRTNAFDLLQNQFGSIVLGFIALGIAAYGIFMLIKSKYPNVDLNS